MFESVHKHRRTRHGHRLGYQPVSSPCEPSAQVGDLKTLFCHLNNFIITAACCIGMFMHCDSCARHVGPMTFTYTWPFIHIPNSSVLFGLMLYFQVNIFLTSTA